MNKENLNASDYWTLFTQTGSPEAYMLYTQKLKSEEQNASYSEGSGPAGYGLQRS